MKLTQISKHPDREETIGLLCSLNELPTLREITFFSSLQRAWCYLFPHFLFRLSFDKTVGLHQEAITHYYPLLTVWQLKILK